MKTTALAFVALALVAAGCKVDNQVSVQMHSICAPPEDAADCSFAAECGAQFIGINAMDTSLTDRLWLFVQINNQMSNNADEGTFRGNSHDAYIEEIEVEFDAPFAIPRTREAVGPFTVPADGTAVVSVFPVNPVASAVIADELVTLVGTSGAQLRIVANTRVKGHLQDDTAFESAPMMVAIDVCDGCFDPNPCVTGLPVAACPTLGQSPASVACK